MGPYRRGMAFVLGFPYWCELVAILGCFGLSE